MTWRERAAPVIAEVIERVGIDDEVRLRKELRDAYPFGPRKYHPYKVWLDEIKFQLGEKERRASGRPVGSTPEPPADLPGQLLLTDV
jgi:hypothetical protein